MCYFRCNRLIVYGPILRILLAPQGHDGRTSRERVQKIFLQLIHCHQNLVILDSASFHLTSIWRNLEMPKSSGTSGDRSLARTYAGMEGQVWVISSPDVFV